MYAFEDITTLSLAIIGRLMYAMRLTFAERPRIDAPRRLIGRGSFTKGSVECTIN